MITSPQQRIDEYTAKGWWGSKTLHDLLEKAVNEHPKRLAIADQPNREQLDGKPPLRLDYSQLYSATNNLAGQLLSRGVGLNDKIIVQLPNIVELVVTYYALSKIGAIISPVPIQYGQHELSGICEVLGATHLITTDQFNNTNLIAEAEKLDDVTLLYFASKTSSSETTLQIETAKSDDNILAKHQQLHQAELGDANRVLTICWTSGTTGTPKGVPRSHNMWLSTTQAIVDACDYRTGDHLLNPFPLVNMAAIGGFLFPATLQTCSLFLHHPLDPPVYLQQLQQEKITFTIAPPALLNQLAKSPAMWESFDFSALRCVGSGSAPLAPWMVETFTSQYAKEIVNFYGSNEGICLLATKETAPLPEQRATMFPRLGAADIPWQGCVYEFAKTKIADPESGVEITQPGQAGELLINGPTIFDGYFFSEQQENVFSEDGYFRTGDLVEICGDPPHYYRIVGRCKDIINRGGVKISPSELDQLLEGHPELKEAAVCAYQDERLGEKICACIVPLDGKAAPDLEQVTRYLKELGIAKFKLPERLETFTQLPRNPMNKVLRRKLSDTVNKRHH